MGSYAYILVAAFIMTGSVFLFSQRTDTRKADTELGRIQMKQEARNAASSALSISMRKLADDPDPWLDPDKYDVDPYSYGDPAATYETVVTIVDAINGDTVDVVATGTKVYVPRNGIARDTTHIIEVRIARGVLEDAIPPGYRYAILADNTLLAQGDLWVNALLPGVNADVHSNGVLDARGNSFIVEGMGSYTTGSGISDQQMDNFTPDDDWNGSDANVFERDSVPIPTWDVDRFRTDAQSQGFHSTDPLVVDGDVIASAGVTTVDQFAEQILGLPPGDYGVTDETPLLVMIDNTVTFDNAVYLDGFVQWGSTGNVDVETHGSEDGLFMSYTADVENQVAFTHSAIFTTADVRIEGNATIQSTLYAEGSITYLGGTHLVGSQVARESNFHGGGTIRIDWVGIGNGIKEYFDPFDEPIGPVIIAYSEW